jgi:hypothetical protein
MVLLAKRVILACALALMASSIAVAAERQYEAVVTPKEGRFVFPVPDQETWRWNRAETAENALEYSWTVAVASGDKTYSFGFNLFKFSGAKPTKGPLRDLLFAGQDDVWLHDKQGGAEIVAGRVLVVAEKDAVVVSITEPRLLKSLFADKPANVTMETVHPDRPAGPSRKSVKVSYSEK